MTQKSPSPVYTQESRKHVSTQKHVLECSFFWLCRILVAARGMEFPSQTYNPGPRRWEHRVLSPTYMSVYSSIIIIAKGNNNPNIYQLMNGYIHTMEYYSTIKRKEVLTHDITRMNFENMRSERSQTEKALESL